MQKKGYGLICRPPDPILKLRSDLQCRITPGVQIKHKPSNGYSSADGMR